MEPQNNNPELVSDTDFEAGLDNGEWLSGQGNPTIENGRLAAGSVLMLLVLSPGVIYRLVVNNANGGKASAVITLDSKEESAPSFYLNKIGANAFNYMCPLGSGNAVLEIIANDAVINQVSFKAL